MSINRIPPNNKEAEESILGSILLDNNVVAEVETIIKEHDFYHPQNSQIFKVMIELFNDKKPIDLISISEVLESRGLLDQVGGIKYLSNLAMSVPTTIHAEYYAKIIAEKSVRRQIIKKSQEIIGDAYTGEYDNAIDIKSNALEVLGGIDINDNHNKRNLLLTAKELIQDIERKRNQASESEEKYYTGIPEFDYWLDGLHEQELTIIGARPSVGKEQPLYSKILTPNGWIRMGDITTDSLIIGSDGKPHKVTGVFPQGMKDIYRVYFSDETYADCGIDHLWETKNRKERKNHLPPSVKTTREIMNSLRVDKDNRSNHSVKYVMPVEFEKKNLPLDPYLLGLLIGDGAFTKGSTIGFSNIEDDILGKLQNLLPESDLLKIGKNQKDHSIIRKIKTNKVSDTVTELKKLCLYNLKSKDKFIPDIYLYSDIEDRLSLLRGLIDTDGYVSGTRSIEYSTSSKKLSNDVRKLVLSLGGRCTINERIGRYIKKEIIHYTIPNYRVHISFSNEIVPVSSKKHLKKYKPSIKKDDKFIKDIVYLGEYEAQCIMVDSPDHLYVTDDYILTHNTALGLQIARNYVKKGLYVPFITLEMSDKQLLTRVIASESKINSQKLRKPKLMSDAEYKKYLKTSEYVAGLPLFIEELKYIQDIRSYCRHLKSKNQLDALFVDYIQLMGTYKKTHSRNEEIGDISRGLKSISKEFKIPVVALAQLGRGTERDSREPRLSDLRESGDIEQDADNVIFIHKPIESDDLAEIQDRKIIIAKQRNGSTGYFDTLFEGKTFDFHSIKK